MTTENKTLDQSKLKNDKKLLIRMLWMSFVFFGGVAALMYFPEGWKWTISPVVLGGSLFVLFK